MAAVLKALHSCLRKMTGAAQKSVSVVVTYANNFVEAHCYVTDSKWMNYLSSICSTKGQIHQDVSAT